LAVIGAYGEGLTHIPEILHPEGAKIVDYSEGSKQRLVESYLSFLESLIEAPRTAQRMGDYNYNLVASDTGKFSLRLRNRELKKAYLACAEEKPELRLEELPHWNHSVPFSMESEEIEYDFAEYANEIGFSGINVLR
jgi:hypothetical protein